MYWLSSLIWIPIITSLVILLIPRHYTPAYKWIALVGTVLQVFISFYLIYGNKNDVVFTEKYEWIRISSGFWGDIHINYHLELDAFNLPLVVLSALVLLISVVSSFEIQHERKGFYSLLMLLSATIMGTFLSLDFFLFFLFFEFMLLPMYFLIGIWGGEKREYASIKFFLYTLVGSLMILMVMIGLYTSAIDPQATAVKLGMVENLSSVNEKHVSQVQVMLAAGEIAPEKIIRTFNFHHLSEPKNYLPEGLLSVVSTKDLGGLHLRFWAFLLIFVGFAIKLPSFPVHTWLPDAHVEAPTCISVLLAGILLKIGGYGMIRWACGIFPEGLLYYAWWIGLFGVISIVYAGLVALGTHHLKRLIAFSSVAHMGFVMLGLASVTVEGISGAIFQMVSHGLISPMLFLIAGVLYARTKKMDIAAYKGLFQAMPYYTAMVTLGFFASLGLPGFSGFIAELLTLIGAFRGNTPAWMPLVALIGLILSASYYLWTLQRMFLGKFAVKEGTWRELLNDLQWREQLMLLPLGILSLILGIFPSFLLDLLDDSLKSFVEFVMETGNANLKAIWHQ